MCVHVCINVYMYVCIYICIYIHKPVAFSGTGPFVQNDGHNEGKVLSSSVSCVDYKWAFKWSRRQTLTLFACFFTSISLLFTALIEGTLRSLHDIRQLGCVCPQFGDGHVACWALRVGTYTDTPVVGNKTVSREIFRRTSHLWSTTRDKSQFKHRFHLEQWTTGWMMTLYTELLMTQWVLLMCVFPVNIWCNWNVKFFSVGLILHKAVEIGNWMLLEVLWDITL